MERAILTDLIGGSAMGNSIQKMISNQLKEILQAETNDGLQFFKMSVLYKNIELDNYWLANPFKFDYEYVDYEKSHIELAAVGNQKIRDIQVSNSAEFEEINLKIKPPERLYFSKIVFKPSISKRLLLIRGVTGGVGFMFRVL
ncbi:hypothetical protein GZH53_01550 [Flavihumibacter sp. R14]|nr:hypothetical protein [Flavihumibacter soli]